MCPGRHSKYETGESLPDVEKSRLIAEVFAEGKHAFGMVKVGEKGRL